MRPVHARLRNRVDKIAVVQQVVRLAKIILGDLKRHILREVVDAAGIALRPARSCCPARDAECDIVVSVNYGDCGRCLCSRINAFCGCRHIIDFFRRRICAARSGVGAFCRAFCACGSALAARHRSQDLVNVGDAFALIDDVAAIRIGCLHAHPRDGDAVTALRDTERAAYCAGYICGILRQNGGNHTARCHGRFAPRRSAFIFV